MSQLNFHKNFFAGKPPPHQFSLSLIQKLVQVYKLWHSFLALFPKNSRYTLGAKIDSLFLEVIELIIKASYSDKTEKLISLTSSSFKLDLLKFFLQIAWDIKSLDNKKYILLSEKLNESIVPMVEKLNTTVTHINTEVGSISELTQSITSIVEQLEKIVRLARIIITSPIIKLIGATAGLGEGIKKTRDKKDNDKT